MKTTKTVRASRRLSSASTRRPVRASRKIVKAEDEIKEIDDIDVDDDVDFDDADFEDAPVEESEILFEAEDVAEVLAEATGEPVDYTVDDETTEVTFTVGENEITVTPEGDEEVVEESTRVRGRKIAASRKMTRKPERKVAASRRIRK